MANPERTLCVVYENFLLIFQIQCDRPKVTLWTYFLTQVICMLIFHLLSYIFINLFIDLLLLLLKLKNRQEVQNQPCTCPADREGLNRDQPVSDYHLTQLSV